MKKHAPANQAIVLCLLLACRDGTGPGSTSTTALYPTSIGMEWHYAFRDTVISGDPEPPVGVFRDTVRHVADTVAAGASWFILENGGLAFDGISGEQVYLRNSPSGLVELTPGLLGLPAFQFTILPAPTRTGVQSASWRVAALNEPVTVPAGDYRAVRYDAVYHGPFPPPETSMLWVVPGVGIVRNLLGVEIDHDSTGREVRRVRFITELESLVVP